MSDIHTSTIRERCYNYFIVVFFLYWNFKMSRMLQILLLVGATSALAFASAQELELKDVVPKNDTALPSDTSVKSTGSTSGLTLILYAGLMICAYKFALKPMYTRLVYLNGENDKLARRNAELKAILDEFIKQNQDVIHGLDNAGDLRYIPDNGTPDKFICPITREIIRQPVFINEGSSRKAYERSALQRWYDRGNYSTPLTRSALINPSSLENDFPLRQEISQYVISRRPSLPPSSDSARAGIRF